MQDRTDTDVAYAAPAIERREDVKGVLGDRTKGSYCPPGVDN